MIDIISFFPYQNIVQTVVFLYEIATAQEVPIVQQQVLICLYYIIFYDEIPNEISTEIQMRLIKLLQDPNATEGV